MPNFLPEVDAANFSRYYESMYAEVEYMEGGVARKFYGAYAGNNTWANGPERRVIGRNAIVNIRVPPLGYYVHNNMPLFAYRNPARTQNKGLAADNSSSILPRDAKLALDVREPGEWTAYLQPKFTEWVGSVQDAVRVILNKDKPYALVNNNLAAFLNCTDGLAGNYVNLFWREWKIGAYDRDGRLIRGNMDFIRSVA